MSERSIYADLAWYHSGCMSEMEFTLRRAGHADAPAVLDLIGKLAEYEKLSGPDADARERFIRDGFQLAPPRFEVWIAEDNAGSALGYALFFETYSTFLARPTLYLEDLFVLPEHRGRGIGKALMNHCIRLAKERGCGRMEWTCLDWNTTAQEFYASLGAQRLSEWYIYRLTAEAMEKL